MPKPEPSFNSRKYQGQIERELIVGGIAITLVVGGGLIAVIWGVPAFFAAMGCFGIALAATAGIWLFLKLLERISA